MAFADIEILGNIGGDPEMRYTPNGKPVTNFNVAVNHSRPDGNGGWEDLGTNWFRVAVFGEAAERHAENLRKGARVLVKGRFHAREYDRNDGGKGTSLDIVASKVLDLGRSARESDDREFALAPQSAGYQNGGSNSDLDDLPF